MKMQSLKSRVFSFCLAFAIAFSFLPAGASGTEPVVEEWRIPFLAFLTGPYAGFGLQIKWAADEAVREINEQGGIAGRPIVIEYHDTALDPAKAATEMAKVVKKSLLIYGPIAATTTKAAMPLAVREKAFAMAVACGLGVNLEFHPWTIHFLGEPMKIIEGTPPERLEMITALEGHSMLNMETARKLDISVPDAIKSDIGILVGD